jgi:hypothetical protein
MYLSAERLALANQTVKETFEQCSVAWQTIPHWDTHDPSQTQVPNDNVKKPAILTLATTPVPFTVTLAEAIAPTPDAVLAAVIANTVTLASTVDDDVFTTLRKGSPKTEPITAAGATPITQEILDTLIAARADVENGGYRAPSCLITNIAGLQQLTKLTTSGFPGTDVLLPPANINSLQRAGALEKPVPATKTTMAYLLGRRQRIAPGGAMDASPGEEALDLAVSIPPSLEVVGEALPASPNSIQMIVRIGYALRVKDLTGYVAIINP